VREAKSVLAQIAGTLAVGESALKFEHRDMHRGNILVRRTKEKDMIFIIDSRKYVLPSEGVHVTVIDYTLSRLSQGILSVTLELCVTGSNLIRKLYLI
jgi:serine/threonine-protein kinase haspin